MRFYVGALVTGCVVVALMGCQSGGGDTGSYDSGVGYQAGSILGGQVGREYGYVGSQVGGLVGQQTERSMQQERGPRP